MSDQHEPELDELRRQLDAAFATTRPRRGFEDELWTRLQGRRPRPARRRFEGFPWAAAGGVAALLVVVVGAIALVASHPRGAANGTFSSAEAPPRTAAGSAAQPLLPGSSAFGALPRPAGAGVPQVLRGGVPSPLPQGSARMATSGASLPSPGPTLPVYSYDPASGPADGTVLQPDALPPGLPAAAYPTWKPSAALSDAAAPAAGAAPSAQQPDLTLTQSRLVYVAVVSGGRGYLEPAYLFTGTAQLGGAAMPVQVLVPALDPSVLR